MYLEKQLGKILILLFIVISNLFAIDWKYKISDSVIKKEVNGQEQYFLDLNVYDYYINIIALYAKQYPPKFDDENQRKEVTTKTKELIKYLEYISKTFKEKNIEIIYRLALANSLAHNLNIENSALKAKQYYETTLAYRPNNAQIYFLYGNFLAHTALYHKQSIPILEKAIALGEEKGLFTLGMVYLAQKNNKEALKLLKQYSKSNPDDPRVEIIIKAIENNNVTIDYYNK